MNAPAAVRLDSLTTLRFFAAFMVLLFHAVPAFINNPKLDLIVSIGRFGVDFFFVLSGFVLAWSWNPRRSRRTFYALRWARVWPLHAFTFALAILAGMGTSWYAGLLNITLLHAWDPKAGVRLAFNTPSWSLACEAFFYALFPLIINRLVRLRNLQLVLALLAALGALLATPVIIHLVPAFWTKAVWLTSQMPLTRLPIFVIGMICALLVQRGVRIPIPAWTAIPCVALLSILAVATPTLTPILWIWQLLILPVIVLAIMRYAGLALERGGDASPSWLVTLGDQSFALYMIHFIVMTTMLNTFAFRGWLALAVMVAVSMTAAALLHIGVERPAERVLRRRILRTEGLGATAGESMVTASPR